MPVLTIAGLTLREASRRRLLIALLLLTVLVIALTGWGFQRLTTVTVQGKPWSPVELRLVASQLLILVMFMFSGVLALSAVFVAAPAISGEVESGIALALLARPLRRRDHVLGKWLGLAVLIGLYTIGAAACEFLVVNAVIGYTPPRPLHAIAYLVAEGVVIMTLALCLSTRLPGMTGGIIATILFFIAWMGGIVGGFGLAYNNTTVTHVGTITKLILPTDGLWRGAIYHLEPAAVIALSRAAGPNASSFPFFVAAPPPAAYLIWVASWVVVMTGLAIYSFQRREL